MDAGKGGEAGWGWAGKLQGSAAQAAVPSQGQVPAAPAGPAEGQDGPGRAARGGGGVGRGGKPGSPPGSWHVGAPARVTARESALPAAVKEPAGGRGSGPGSRF